MDLLLPDLRDRWLILHLQGPLEPHEDSASYELGSAGENNF